MLPGWEAYPRMSKDYRDPLYGFITVNSCEQRIIDSRYFQRGGKK